MLKKKDRAWVVLFLFTVFAGGLSGISGEAEAAPLGSPPVSGSIFIPSINPGQSVTILYQTDAPSINGWLESSGLVTITPPGIPIERIRYTVINNTTQYLNTINFATGIGASVFGAAEPTYYTDSSNNVIQTGGEGYATKFDSGDGTYNYNNIAHGRLSDSAWAIGYNNRVITFGAITSPLPPGAQADFFIDFYDNAKLDTGVVYIYPFIPSIISGYPPSIPTGGSLDDYDSDGLPNSFDNCPYDYNPDQGNIGGTPEGDACRNFTVLYNDDFDSYPVGPLTSQTLSPYGEPAGDATQIYLTDGSASIDNPTGDIGSGLLRFDTPEGQTNLSSQSSSWVTNTGKPFDSGVYTFTWRSRKNSGNQFSGPGRVTVEGVGGIYTGPMASIEYSGDHFHYMYGVGGSIKQDYDTGIPYSLGVSQTFKLVVHLDSRQFRLFINDTPAGPPHRLINDEITAMDRIRFLPYGAPQSSYSFDYIRIRKGGIYPDTDGDGVPDVVDNCPAVANASQLDSNWNGVGDACEPIPDPCASRGGDTDGDGVCDDVDNCRFVANSNQADNDGDGVGDACDNCPPRENQNTYNPDQADTDGDGIGNICDACPLIFGSIENSGCTSGADLPSGRYIPPCPAEPCPRDVTGSIPVTTCWNLNSPAGLLTFPPDPRNTFVKLQLPVGFTLPVSCPYTLQEIQEFIDNPKCMVGPPFVFPDELKDAFNPADPNGEWCVTINVADLYSPSLLKCLAPNPGDTATVSVQIAHGQFVRDTETCTNGIDKNGLPCYTNVWYGFAGIQDQTIQLDNKKCSTTSSSNCFVGMDMMPGTTPNVIIKGSNATVPVTILSQKDPATGQITFDATKLTQNDLLSIRLKSIFPPPTMPGQPAITIQDKKLGKIVKVEIVDTNKDGVKDIMIFFANLGKLLAVGEHQIELEGRWGAKTFTGSDMLVVKP